MSSGSNASGGGSGNAAAGGKLPRGTVAASDPSTWKGSYREFAFNVDKDTKVRLHLASDFAGSGENFSLQSENSSTAGNPWNENPWVYNNGDGTGYCDLELHAGRTYYMLSKDGNVPFTITDVEVL